MESLSGPLPLLRADTQGVQKCVLGIRISNISHFPRCLSSHKASAGVPKFLASLQEESGMAGWVEAVT